MIEDHPIFAILVAAILEQASDGEIESGLLQGLVTLPDLAAARARYAVVRYEAEMG